MIGWLVMWLTDYYCIYSVGLIIWLPYCRSTFCSGAPCQRRKRSFKHHSNTSLISGIKVHFASCIYVHMYYICPHFPKCVIYTLILYNERVGHGSRI